MDIRKLQHLIVDALEDLKGQNISAFNTVGLTDLFDRVVIVTGTSNRHTRSLAASVRDKVKAAGGSILSLEGEETGEWVLVDLGDAVVHIMQPPIRSYYNLEELWGAKPVALTLGKASGAGKAKVARKAPDGRPSRKTSVARPAKKTISATPAKKTAVVRAKKKAGTARPAKKTAARVAAGKTTASRTRRAPRKAG
jgi:ribosome-associated protein